MEGKEKLTQTPAFGIAAVILLLIFITILKNLPFPKDYGFVPLAGIAVGTCIIGFIIYMIAIGVVESVFKIIVEIAGAILLFINVVFIASCWAYFEQIKLYINNQGIFISWNQTFVTIGALFLFALIFNLLVVFILYPISRVAGTRLDPE